jgi:hypothetical protein
MTSGGPDSVRVSNDELATVRDAMRELNRMLDALDRGELEKIVLTQRNQMRAVIVSLERYTQLEQDAADAPEVQVTLAPHPPRRTR